jgi:hypothetical protein
MGIVNTAEVLMEIGTDLIYGELKRRAASQGMSVDELVAKAKENWQNAETAADDLANKGHE